MIEEKKSGPPRPCPRPEGMDEEFYARAKATGRLHFQRCDDCQTWRHPPRYMCPSCGSVNWSWQPSSGRGSVYSWTITHQALHPAFAAETPFVVGIIALAEGVRMVSRIEGCKPSEVTLGMPVEVFLKPASEQIMLPYFRKA